MAEDWPRADENPYLMNASDAEFDRKVRRGRAPGLPEQYRISPPLGGLGMVAEFAAYQEWAASRGGRRIDNLFDGDACRRFPNSLGRDAWTIRNGQLT